MKSLDTNALLRLLLADVPEQAAKVELLLTDTSQKFVVADMVFAELVWVLQGDVYQYNRERIAVNLRVILAVQNIKCNRNLIEKALALYVAHETISFIDAYLAAYAEIESAMPLLTFDKKLATALPKVAVKI